MGFLKYTFWLEIYKGSLGGGFSETLHFNEMVVSYKLNFTRKNIPDQFLSLIFL